MSEEMIMEQATEQLRNVLQGMAQELCEQCRAILETEIEETHDKALKDSEAEPCKDTISRRAVIEKIHWLGLDHDTAIMCDLAIRALPSVTPKQRTGHWIECEDEVKVYCSECKEISDYPTNYCPSCGADMREKNDGD